jgi:ferric-dicitrate binding protein FerR (iron transport regulator)
MQEHIQTLITGYFSGNLCESDQERLRVHLGSNPEDQKTFDDYRLLWEESGLNKTLNPIDIERDLKKTKSRLSFGKPDIYIFFQQAAAVFILAALFSSAFIYFYKPGTITLRPQTPVNLQEVTTVFGTRSKFLLSDGTIVHLNSGSKLLFPFVFSGNTRKVELVGEAYFEVATDPANPFVVKTSEINVKVLGTKFNLQAYAGSNEITTTLVKGKVLLERELSGITHQVAALKPSERAVFHLSEKAIDISAEEDLDKFIAWKDGKLVFFNDPIENVAEKLGYWYNIKVKIGNSQLKRYRFTATFTDEPIEQVLDLLSKSSPIRYRIIKASKLSDNSYSKREIVFN